MLARSSAFALPFPFPFLQRSACAIAILGLSLASCSADREELQPAPPARAHEAAPADATDSAQAVLERTAALLETGEAAHALWEAETGLSAFPSSNALRVRVAEIALLVGNPALSRATVQGIESGSPYRSAALIALARAELALGDIESALGVLQRGQNEFPSRSEIRLLRIGMLAGAQRRDEALAVIAEALDDYSAEADLPKRRPFEVSLARAHAAEGDPDAAIDALLAIVTESHELIQLWAAISQLLWQQGRADEAVALIATAIADDPEVASALRPMKARLHVSMGQLDEAEETLRAAIEASASIEAYLALADLQVLRGQPDRASEELANAIARYPEDRMVRAMRIESLILQGSPAEAEAALARAEAMEPDHSYLEFLRARIELAQGHPQRAADRLRTLIPRLDIADTQYWLGRALEESGDFAGSERRYALAIPRRTGWTAPRLALTRLSRRRGDWASMAHHARALVRTAPGNFESWVILSEALGEQGAHKKLRGVSETIQSKFFDRPEAHIVVARSLRRSGHSEEALETLSAAAQRFGPQPDIEAERALTLGMSGKVAEGIAIADAASIANPDSPRLLWASASLHFAVGNAAEASADVDRALALEPGNPEPLRLRCEYWTATGNFDAAVSDCSRYSQMRPDNPRAHFALAIAEEGRKQPDAAIAAYRRAAELDRDGFAALNNLALLLADEGDLSSALDAGQRAYRRAPNNIDSIDTLANLYLRVGLHHRAIALLERARTIAPENKTLGLRLEQARRSPPKPLEIDRHSAACATEAPPAERAAASPSASPLGDSLAGANVLLILVDTLRADATSAYDSSLDTSPELASWAAHGVLFERVRSQSSWTKISVASLMTSLWPSSHGIHEPDDGLSSEAVTLAEVFRDNRYATYGVQTNGWLHQSFGFHQGFDRYLLPRGGSQKLFPRATVWPHADRVYDEMVRTLDAHDPSRPFFMYLHFMDVHEYAAPPEFKRYGTDSRGAYLAAVRWVDDTLRRIREKLDTLGLLDRTLIVFASDHGETFGEHGVYGHARNVLMPVLTVPLIFRLPAGATVTKATKPVRVASQVRMLDLAPTILDAVQIERPPSFEGASLLPLIESGQPVAAPDRVTFAGLGKPLFRDASVQLSVSDGHWTYARNIEKDADPAELLFDRCVDPGENVNLIAMETLEAGRMRGVLDDNLARAVGDVREQGVTIDPGIAARLRALGYLDDDMEPSAPR